MIVDSSVIVAIVFREPGFASLVSCCTSTAGTGIGTPTLVETGIVLTARLGRSATGLLAHLVDELGLQIVPFGDAHWRAAIDAYVRFGKGRHAAALNFGDCMTYATASLAAQPLLCVGEDFKRTDLALVAISE